MADRIITYSYAAANYDAFKRKTIPISGRAMTKAAVLEHIMVNPDLLVGYTSNRLVPTIKVQGLAQSAYYDFNDIVLAIGVQSDNKIIVGGKFTSYRGVAVNQIVRLNTDGTLDTSFDTGVGFTATASYPPIAVTKIIVQADDKILVGGLFNSYKTVTKNSILRMTSNGDVDTTFNGGISMPIVGGIDAEVTAMHLFENTYYVSCRLSNFTEGRLYKCDMNGALVTGFNYNNNTTIGYDITDDGGYIYIGGGKDGGGFVFKINKLTGTIISPFAVTGGVNFIGIVYGLVYQASTGKLIVSGNFNSYYPPGSSTVTSTGIKVCRISTTTGLIDEAFRSNIAPITSQIDIEVQTFVTVELDSSDNILLGAYTNTA